MQDKILDELRGMKPVLQKQYRVSRIGVFGSVARSQAGPGSDIDIVVEMTEPDLFSLVHLKDALEQRLGSRVDIVHYREHMNPFLKEHIRKEAIYV